MFFMDLSFFLPTAVVSLQAFGLQGFVHRGRSNEFFCAPLIGLHFLLVSVMVDIINRQDLGSLGDKSRGMSRMQFLEGVNWCGTTHPK